MIWHLSLGTQLVICAAWWVVFLAAVTRRGRRLACIFAEGVWEGFRDPVPPIVIGVIAAALGLGVKGSVLAVVAFSLGESRAQRGARR